MKIILYRLTYAYVFLFNSHILDNNGHYCYSSYSDAYPIPNVDDHSSNALSLCLLRCETTLMSYFLTKPSNSEAMVFFFLLFLQW